MKLAAQLDDRQFLRPREVARLTGLSRSKVMLAIRTGALPARKLDGCLLIGKPDYETWVATAQSVRAG